MDTTNDVNLIDYKSRDAWLSARGLGIGASESAALFGLAPEGRESEYSLWAKKAGLVEPDQLDGEWLEWGQILEQPIADRYAKRTGHVLWTPPTPTPTPPPPPSPPSVMRRCERWRTSCARTTPRRRGCHEPRRFARVPMRSARPAWSVAVSATSLPRRPDHEPADYVARALDHYARQPHFARLDPENETRATREYPIITEDQTHV